MDERRNESRADVQTSVKVYVESIGEFITTYSKNLSAGGMMIRLESSVEKGATVRVEFRLKSEHPLIQTTAAVQWVRQAEGGFTAGIKFLGLDEKAKTFIDEAIKLHRQGKEASLDGDDFLAPPQGGTEIDFGTEEIDGDDLQELDAADVDFVEEVEELETVDLAPHAPAATPLDADSLEDLDLGEMAEPEAAPPPATDDLFTMTEDMDTVDADAVETVEDVEQQSFGFSDDHADMDDSISLSEEIDLTGGAGAGKKSKLPLIAGMIVAIAAVAGGAVFMLGGGSDSRLPLPVENVPEPESFAAAVSGESAATVTAEARNKITEGVAVETVSVKTTKGNARNAKSEATKKAAPKPALAKAVASKAQPARTAKKSAKKVAHKSSKAGKAGKVLGISVQDKGNTSKISIRLDGVIAKVRSFAMSKPPRYVVDLYGVTSFSGRASLAFDDPLVKKIRLGRHKDKVRLVFDLKSAKYRAKRSVLGDKVEFDLRR